MSKQQEISTIQDEELLKEYLQKNNAKSLETLFDRYIRFVFLISMKYLRNEEKAKDAAMQIFEKVMADVHRFEIENFKSWLHVVTRNYCLMQLRAKKSSTFFSLDNEKEKVIFMENDSSLHHTEEKEERLVQLEKAIEMLEDEQKRCVELFFLKEKSYKEVSEMTGYTMNEVKSHIQNGKRNLKNILVKHGDTMLYVFVYLYFIK